MRTAGRPVAILGLVLGIVLAALLSTYWIGGGTVGTASGDPDSAAPNGARAVASLLRERGSIDVRTARGSDQVGDAGGGTLVIATSRKLSDQGLDRLRQAARTAGTVVLIRPHEETLAALAPLVIAQGRTSGVLRADCTLGGLGQGWEISGDAQLYRVRGVNAPGTGTCFRQESGASRPGAVALSGSPGQRVVVVGNTQMLTNARLREVDNAAVTLGLLGQHRRLVWYTALAEDAAAPKAADQRPWPPPWLGPVALASAGIVAALMLWRGRRLGRLATEPLPVLVQANETALARGRLYRRGKDPGHAARVLQDAVRRRLGAALAVPPTAGPAALAEAAARATGRDPGAIHDLLTRSPAGERELAALMRDLTQLDREARRG